jgi:serine protease Do
LKPNTFPLEIAEVQPGSPASKAGLKTGMQVVSVNGKTPRSVVDFNEQIMTGEGHAVALIVVENGQRRPVQVKLMPFEELIRQRTGLTLQEMTAQMAARLRLRDGSGLLIEKVEPGSPAAAAELKAGMLLTGFNQSAVNELRDVGLGLISGGTNTTARLSLIVPQTVGSGFVQLRQGTADIKLR